MDKKTFDGLVDKLKTGQRIEKMSKKSQIVRQIEVCVQIDVYEPETMFLREAIASGELGDREFEYSKNMYSHGTLVRFDHGEWYLLSPEALLRGLSEGLEQEQEAHEL